MHRLIAMSLSLALGTFVLGVVAEPTAHAAPKKKGKKGKKGKNKGPVVEGHGPFEKDEYPLAEKNRPLILPNQMGEVVADLGYNRAFGTDLVGLGVGFNFGLGDIVELGVATGLTLAPDVDFSRTVALQAHWLAWDSKEFDFAPGIVIPLIFVDNAPISATIDLSSRYILSKDWYLYFGQGAIPIGVSPGSLAISANGGVGWQVAKPTVLFADTSVFTLLIAPDFDATGLWENLVLNLGGQYSPTPEVDIGGKISLNNYWDVPDSFGFGIGAFGRLRF